MDYAFTLINVSITAIVSLLASNYAQGKINLSKKNKKRTAARDNALTCLLRVKLIEYHDRYMEKGSIPSYALENYEHMYSAYHDLGGNGMVARMHEEILELPVNQ